MEVKITKRGKKTTIEGDSQFFAWLRDAAGSAANGFQGNEIPDRLELVTTQPADLQPSGSRRATRPKAPALDGSSS